MPRRTSKSPGPGPRRSRSPSSAGVDVDFVKPSPLEVSVDTSPGHDRYSAYFYRPHFLTALFSAFAVLAYVAFFTSGVDQVCEYASLLGPCYFPIRILSSDS